MVRRNFIKNQHYIEEDIPLERQHNSDDAMEIDEDVDDQDANAGEDDVNMDINTEMEIVPRGRLDGFTGSPTFAPSGLNHLPESNQVRQENLDHLLNQLMKHAIERKLTNDRVFNMDETVFGQKTKSRKVIPVRGSKNVWTNASGSCLPPLFLLPGQQRLNRDILSECSVPDATVAVALKAFMNQAIFVKWLEHFAARESLRRRLRFLLLLPPNSTHILQPLDVSVFTPFKTSLRRSMDRFMIDEDVSSLTKKPAIS
uniref:AlNc14C16G1762 protein n=1 Tax=Albugo laibachii Nc14 TaxID=890382 RepID=F0W486_9STRA|nr:AlNc14C16G1762 [Albugo laibachii Nc14]|eukprot:CCA15902.1 AlNc14C16G1762 [Albugo laibachii Nc14]